MSAITKNLPWFVKEPAVALIGEGCYRSLVEELNISDVVCLKYSLSKGLGLGIVVGGAIMKVPQILLILSARSARGLSLPAFALETVSYAITLFYSYRNEFPFSTYGENFFLTLQNTLITILIVRYPSQKLSLRHSASANNVSAKVAATVLATLASFYALAIVPHAFLALLQMATLPLSLFSKLPQIATNARNRSTGQLSVFAVGSQVAGCLARLFTTSTEVGDPILFVSFLLALVLNAVLAVQIWMFWGRDEVGYAGLDSDEKHESIELEGRASPDPDSKGRVDNLVPSIPAQAGVTGAGGRRWARKVD